MAQLIRISWRDIPAQVVDRAARRARQLTADAYRADWRRASIEVEGDIGPLVRARVADATPE